MQDKPTPNPGRPIARRYADAVVRRRWWIVGAWVLVTGAMFLFVKPVAPSEDERASFLPRSMPSRRAAEALGEYFPHNSGLSESLVIFERRGRPLRLADEPRAGAEPGEAPVEGPDRKAIREICQALRRGQPGITTRRDLADVHVRSPLALPNSPMVSSVSDRGQAALIVTNIPANFITQRAARMVRHTRRVIEQYRPKLPQGLDVYVTGSAAFGYDYAVAADRSHDRTLWVTLVSVVLILLIVYRAPVAGVIPLAAISLAAVVALSLMALLGHVGLITGTAEKIFVVVLLYGAGIDYSLLLISRCREFLPEYPDPQRATEAGLETSLPAILASAGTDTAGLLMLSFARFAIFQTTGISVAVALLVALLAAITLVPALVSIAGDKLFWPGYKPTAPPHASRVWTRLASLVTRRPGTVMLVTLALLAVPAIRGAHLTWVYDTVSNLSEDYDCVQGTGAVRRHWPIGEICPVHVLLRAERGLSAKEWQRADRQVFARLARLKGVHNVRCLTDAFGNNNHDGTTTRGGSATRSSDPPGQTLADQAARWAPSWIKKTLRLGTDVIESEFRQGIRNEYISGDGRACRLVVILTDPGLSLKAMAAVNNVRSAIGEALARLDLRAADGRSAGDIQVHLAGTTAEKIDVREVTHGDFFRIAALVLAVIFLMVLVLLRDWLLSAFMIVSTIVSYLATLGICYWVFLAAVGIEGLDWKVEVFLFVVMVAVGQDYNIFLAARLAQEGRSHPPLEATRRALIHTGPVISSCGLIMAATLGSLMASVDLRLLVQLGFALSLGMLIDTFIVRPLLLPAFAVLTGRTGKSFRSAA